MEKREMHASAEKGKEQHRRSDQRASLGKEEKLWEKVESDWAKEMRHMLGKIRHRIKRHRDRARSPPRHRRPIENNQVSSSVALPGSQSQTSSRSSSHSSQQRTSSHSSKSLTSPSRSRTSSLASPSSQSLTASSPNLLQSVSSHQSSSPVVSSCWPASQRTITSQISSPTDLRALQVSSHASSNSVQVSSPTMNSKLRPAEPSITEPGPKDDTTQTTGYLPKYPEYLKQPDRDENGIRLGKVKEQLPRQLEDQSQLFLVGIGIGALSTTTMLLKPGQAVSRAPNGDDSNQRGADGTRNSTTRGVEVKELPSRTMLGVTLRHSSTGEVANGIEVLFSSMSPDKQKQIQVEENAGVHGINTNSATGKYGITQNFASQETKATIPFRKFLVVEHSLLIDEVRTLIDSGPDGRGSKGSRLCLANLVTPSLGFQPIGERKGENFSDLGLWQLDNLKSHDSTVVHNCWRLLKFYETKPAITNHSIIDTSCCTEKWMKNGELCIGLVAGNELSNSNNIKTASNTLIISEVIILEESHENRETRVASECLKSTATNETALDIYSVATPFVILKERVLKLLVQQSRRYWEGRGSRMKMKFKIKAVSYHPP
ncbi:unnamed protein product [Cuscuta epithymum]|uniref:Uncharacterized protein n=1 Tax=Cuscuta epithymum TaxID=186058 RepID=A0AAV0DYP0_9ASTE|nr:unnamed protein product [Cuscuta epithymum]